MSDGKRGLVSDPVVTRFRGINKFVNTSELTPETAQDLMNVICSLSGGLVPLRTPVPLTVNPSDYTSIAATVLGTSAPWDPTLGSNTTYKFGYTNYTYEFIGSRRVTALKDVLSQPFRNEGTFTIPASTEQVIALALAGATSVEVTFMSGRMDSWDRFGNSTWDSTDGTGTPVPMQVSGDGGVTFVNLMTLVYQWADATLTPLHPTLWDTPLIGNHAILTPPVGAVYILFGTPADSVGHTEIDNTGQYKIKVKLTTSGVTTLFSSGFTGSTAPVSVDVVAGQVLNISASGLVTVKAATTAGPAGITYDAGDPFPGDGTINGLYPASFIPGATALAPIKWGGLMGTFVNNAGTVISTFGIGVSHTGVVVPAGATHLLLGVNDDDFTDNSGSFTVHIDVLSTGSGALSFTDQCHGFFDYQRADGVRQLVSVWGTKIYSMSAINGEWQAAVLVDDDPDNAFYWSFAFSSNILFMANGKRMLKWNGTGLSKWGIRKPSNAPSNPVVHNGSGGVTLITGRKYRAAYKNSAMGTLSSASDASISSGVCTDADITTSLDAVADAAADPQIDTVVWYSTLDADDGIYYYNSEVPINKSGVTLLTDDEADPSTSPPTTGANASTLADDSKQQALTGSNWEFITFGTGQWRTKNSPAVGGDLPVLLSRRFDISVPINATVTGVKVRFSANGQASTTSFVEKMQLYQGTTPIGTAKTFISSDFPLAGGAPADFEFGDATDLWGATIDPTNIGTDFGFGITLKFASDVRLFVYSFDIWVYYTLPSSSSTTVNEQIQAQLINDPPPLGKYLLAWGGRIAVAGIADNPQDVAYSGYEQILDGRPEEAFPPGNRLRITSGADSIRGMGTVQAGMLIGSKSNEMYMLRGELEDVVTGTPLNFTEQLEPLPFNSAFASHYAILDSPDGAIYLAAQRSIDNYNGTGRPQTWSLPIAPILRDVPDALEEVCIGAFYNYLDKDWAIFAIPGPGQTQPSQIIVIDTDLNQDNNTGIFLFDIGTFDTIGIVEHPASGRPMILVAQNGQFREVKAISSGVNTLTDIADAADSVPLTQPFWHSGWWASDSPQTTSMFRHAYLVKDGGVPAVVGPPPVPANDFTLEARLVDDRTHTFRDPEVKTITNLPYGKGTINRKSKRCSVKIKFPVGVNASVQQLWVSRIPTSER